MKPYQHQIELADKAYAVLKQHMLVYLACEERTGKTLASILVCEQADVQNVLVITKKKAITGWQETLKQFKHTKIYTVTNYHQAKKFAPSTYDLVILDEAHNYISGFPKRSAIWLAVRRLAKRKPLIYLSATPYAQGAQLLYNQLALSDWSPFRSWTTGYSWFKSFGIPESVWISGRNFETYKKVKTAEVLPYIQDIIITQTRKEIGHTYEPADKLHYIGLMEETKRAYNIMVKKKVVQLEKGLLVCDTPIKLRCSLHMLEGGVAKIEDSYIVLANDEKIQYIKQLWGDIEDMVIMYNYIAEGMKLEQHFQNAQLLQATSNAEGIDLSHIRNLIIYSQDFSAARHTQRRARQANQNRDTPIIVHYLLVKNAISEQVYQAVSLNKTNFVDSVFNKETI